ncbi:hypothetical protein [Roseibium sp.]|uniref:hypothetical protein n=1 Tax=Roseibium sp. TaxID=1936156 RepID=UPI003A96F6FD
MELERHSPETAPIIDTVLRLFEAGDQSILNHIAPDIDFRIDHFRDEADVSWQNATNIQEFITVLTRLASDVFPKGTTIVGLATQGLGNGWAFTRFEQRFFYAVQNREVQSVTYITSHETVGKMDFFRETVTTIEPV